jgi:hypothetical protein
MTTVTSADDIYEFPYIRPEKLGLVEGWKREIWNPNTRQVLGRTGKSWGESLFYNVTIYDIRVKCSHALSLNLCKI